MFRKKHKHNPYNKMCSIYYIEQKKTIVLYHRKYFQFKVEYIKKSSEFYPLMATHSMEWKRTHWKRQWKVKEICTLIWFVFYYFYFLFLVVRSIASIVQLCEANVVELIVANKFQKWIQKIQIEYYFSNLLLLLLLCF